MVRSKVAVVKLEDNIEDGLKKALSLMNITAFPSNANIIIKPNLCGVIPSDGGATTDLRVIDALIKTINESSSSSKIYIVESDSESRDAEEVFTRLGYKRLEEMYSNVRLVNLSTDELFDVKHPRGLFLKKVKLAKTLLYCDYFISVAKLKTHVFEKITCILKNQFGLLPDRQKSMYHPYLSKVLMDINSLIRPNLCIVDGIVGMEGPGPTEGNPKRMNLLICGNEPVATDAIAAKIMGLNPKRVPHLVYASRHGIGTMKDVIVRGVDLNDFVDPFKFIPFSSYLLYRLGLSIERIGNSISNIGKAVFRVGRGIRLYEAGKIEVKQLTIKKLIQKLKET